MVWWATWEKMFGIDRNMVNATQQQSIANTLCTPERALGCGKQRVYTPAYKRCTKTAVQGRNPGLREDAVRAARFSSQTNRAVRARTVSAERKHMSRDLATLRRSMLAKLAAQPSKDCRDQPRKPPATKPVVQARLMETAAPCSRSSQRVRASVTDWGCCGPVAARAPGATRSVPGRTPAPLAASQARCWRHRRQGCFGKAETPSGRCALNAAAAKALRSLVAPQGGAAACRAADTRRQEPRMAEQVAEAESARRARASARARQLCALVRQARRALRLPPGGAPCAQTAGRPRCAPAPRGAAASARR